MKNETNRTINLNLDCYRTTEDESRYAGLDWQKRDVWQRARSTPYLQEFLLADNGRILKDLLKEGQWKGEMWTGINKNFYSVPFVSCHLTVKLFFEELIIFYQRLADIFKNKEYQLEEFRELVQLYQRKELKKAAMEAICGDYYEWDRLYLNGTEEHGSFAKIKRDSVCTQVIAMKRSVKINKFDEDHTLLCTFIFAQVSDKLYRLKSVRY